MAGGVVQGEEAVEGVDVEGVAVEVINRVCPCGVLTETLFVHCGSWRRITYEYFAIAFVAVVALVEIMLLL